MSKGQVYRPCRGCGVIVNFILWKDDPQKRPTVYHWANEDGSHHVCDKGPLAGFTKSATNPAPTTNPLLRF
jgi:hypothetical protein